MVRLALYLPFLAYFLALVSAAEQQPLGFIDPLKEIGGMSSSAVTCRDESSTHCGGMHEDDPYDEIFYADRFIKAALNTMKDGECMRSEIDRNSPDFSIVDAARRFRKCRHLVIRNAMPPSLMKKYRDGLARYIADLRSGALDLNGTTTRNEPYFIQEVDDKRWLLLVPPEFAAPEILSPKWLSSILSHPRILGNNFVLNDAGVAIAEPGANAQSFHCDADYLFSMYSLTFNNIGGHDLPSYAVTVLHPMMDEVKSKHGPTEFCMGTTHLSGTYYESENFIVKNKTLAKLLKKYYAPKGAGYSPECTQGGAMRTDTMKIGDIVLFDYQILHRGGPNGSPETRALLYNTYSRDWFQDTNFKATGGVNSIIDKAENRGWIVGEGIAALSKSERKSFELLVRNSRMALPKSGLNVEKSCASMGIEPTKLESLTSPIFSFDPSS